MSWRVELRYNGRKEGAGRTIVREIADEADVPDDALLREMQRDAVRSGGNEAIFVMGWSVDWIDPPLTDEETPAA